MPLDSEFLYGELSRIEKKFNPCDFDINGHCVGFRNGELGATELGCCLSGCSAFQEGHGCTTKHLPCKSFLCKSALDSLPKEVKTQHHLINKVIRRDFGIGEFRDSMGVFKK